METSVITGGVRIDRRRIDGDAAVLPGGHAVDPDDGLGDHPLGRAPAGQRRNGGDVVLGDRERTASPAERWGSEPTPVAVPGRRSARRGTPRASTRCGFGAARAGRTVVVTTARSLSDPATVGCSRPAPESAVHSAACPPPLVPSCGSPVSPGSSSPSPVGRRSARRLSEHSPRGAARRDGGGVGGMGGRRRRPRRAERCHAHHRQNGHPRVDRRRRRRHHRRRRPGDGDRPAGARPHRQRPRRRPPSSGAVYIQASAYGDELRFGLRPPIGYLAGVCRDVARHGDGHRARSPGARRPGVGTRDRLCRRRPPRPRRAAAPLAPAVAPLARARAGRDRRPRPGRPDSRR